MKSAFLKVFGVLMVLVLALPVVSALAQGDPEPIELPAVDPLALEGDIAIAGSSTVEPVTVAMAARFNEDGFSGNIPVAETGTSAGFERFCKEGSTDISNASRAIKDSEVADCEAIGREVVEFYIGIDALTVAVSKESPVEQLKRSELYAIFTGAVTMWNEVNPEWPAEAIELYTPGVDSGTFDFFGEAVLGTKGPYAEREARFDALLAANPTTSENDNTLVEGILGSPYAIGYFGYAYFVENEETLKAVEIVNDMKNDDDGNLVAVAEEEWGDKTYVLPSYESASAGEYMLARPLFIYSAKNILLEKPQVAGFINYYLTNTEEVVAEVGYFPLSVEDMNATKQIWLDVMAEAGM
jgi:phosphate binding protein